MDNTTSTANSETRSSGYGLTRLMLGRSFDSAKVTVDKSTVSNSTNSNIINSANESSSSGVGGQLTRTWHQIGKLFNSSIITGVSASVLPERGAQTTTAITKTPQKTLPWDTLSPMDESFSRRGSFGRTYSFTRCASFSSSNSFTKHSS